MTQITVQATTALKNGNLTGGQPNSVQITQNNPGTHVDTPKLSTTEAVISLGSVQVPGIVQIVNLDETAGNDVIFGPESAGAMVPAGRVKAASGAPAQFRWEQGVTMRWKATAGTPQVRIEIFED